VNALSIEINSKNVKELDIEFKANSVYTFFNSILIDEILTLNNHTIFADANALSLNKSACFIGEQLIVGNALIIGKNGQEEVDATIPHEELSTIINYDVPKFYKDVLALLSTTDINLYRNFSVTQNEEKISLSTEWVLYTFNIADEKTKEYFLTELTKALHSNKNVNEFMQKMAGLAINAGAMN